jgi:AcrR family transcriptional regulator
MGVSAAPGSGRRRVGRPTGGDSADTRQRILHAAVRCFASRGLARTTLREVSDAADLTTGTLYHHFSSKEELYVAAYTWTVGTVYERFDAATADVAGLRPRLLALLDCALELHTHTPELQQMILRAWVEHADADADPLPIPPVVTEFLTGIVAEAVARGELDPEDGQALMDVFRCMMWGIMTIALTRPEAPASAVEGLKRVLEGTLILDGNVVPADRP